MKSTIDAPTALAAPPSKGVGAVQAPTTLGLQTFGTATAKRFPKTHPLYTWRSLNVVLEKLDEEAAWDLLRQEVEGPARVQLLLRLYGRANKLRAQRERREVLGG